MPTSIDPQPADNEIECGRCGAYFYYELTRCPNCGVNVYEPDDEPTQGASAGSPSQAAQPEGLLTRLDGLFRRITRQPYAADQLFGAAINEADLFNNLLLKVGGDRPTAERMIDFEHRQLPQGNRLLWLENAIRRWERDNRSSGTE